MKWLVSLLTVLTIVVIFSTSQAEVGAFCANSCYDQDGGCNYPGAKGNDWMMSCDSDEWCFQKNDIQGGVCLKVQPAGNEQGCCSHHGGVDHCRYDNHVICKDGKVSPSCMCK